MDGGCSSSSSSSSGAVIPTLLVALVVLASLASPSAAFQSSLGKCKLSPNHAVMGMRSSRSELLSMKIAKADPEESHEPPFPTTRTVPVDVLQGGMRMRNIPRSDIEVSELCLGTMMFGDQVRTTCFIVLGNARTAPSTSICSSDKTKPLPVYCNAYRTALFANLHLLSISAHGHLYGSTTPIHFSSTFHHFLLSRLHLVPLGFIGLPVPAGVARRRLCTARCGH